MVQDIRELNRQAVLTELLRSRPASRKEVARRAGISAATVTRVVDQLIADGLVVEGAEIVVENRGRRARIVDLVADRAHVVGIDLGASTTRFVVTDLIGTPVTAAVVPTPGHHEARALASWLASGDRGTDIRAPRHPCADRPRAARCRGRGRGPGLQRSQPAADRGPRFPRRSSRRSSGTDRDRQRRELRTPRRAAVRRGQCGSDRRHDHPRGRPRVGARDRRTVAPRQARAGRRVRAAAGRPVRGVPSSTRSPAPASCAVLESGIPLESPAELFSARPGEPLSALRAHFDQALLVVLTAIAVSCAARGDRARRRHLEVPGRRAGPLPVGPDRQAPFRATAGAPAAGRLLRRRGIRRRRAPRGVPPTRDLRRRRGHPARQMRRSTSPGSRPSAPAEPPFPRLGAPWEGRQPTNDPARVEP